MGWGVLYLLGVLLPHHVSTEVCDDVLREQAPPLLILCLRSLGGPLVLRLLATIRPAMSVGVAR